MSESKPTPELQGTSSTEAFQALGSDIRMSILEALAETNDAGALAPATKSFSELASSSPTDTSAQFAYHLRQLTNYYLTEVDDEYRLTYAGMKIVRAVMAGMYTDHIDIESIPVEAPCPFCADGLLQAQSTGNYVSISCDDCHRRILTLPFPPGGHLANSDEQFLDAFDRLYRHRISLMADGFCPECGATTTVSINYLSENEASSLPETDSYDPIQCHLSCEHCGYRLQCPVTLCILGQPAVISFYYDHGQSIDKRPIWNVGSEWGEYVLSDDPWYVRISTRLDDEVLSLLLDGDTSVVETQRQQAVASDEGS